MLNGFAKSVGADQSYQFCDVFGLDEELLLMTPQPCVALTLLFPTEKMREYRSTQQKKIEETGQHVSDKLFYVKQHDSLGNACGTIAAIHALANSGVPLSGAIGDFVKSHTGKTADDIGKALEVDTTLKGSSEQSAQDTGLAQTETPDREAPLGYHFIAFIPKDGHLYELDGRKAFPINHGSTTEETFLLDAARAIKECFIANDPDNVNFNIMALVKA